MSGDPVRVGEGLNWEDRIRAIGETAVRLSTVRDQISRERDAKVREIADLVATYDKLVKVGNLFRMLMDRMVDAQVHVVEGVVTKGLKSIFHDQSLSFSAKVAQRNNRVHVDFFLCKGDPEKGGHEGEPLESFGGGPSSFTGLVLRILTLLRLKRRPLLLLDETLSAVSDEYIDATGQFLQRLAETSHVDLLLVTHKHAFLDHADRAYQASETAGEDGTTWLTVKKLRGQA